MSDELSMLGLVEQFDSLEEVYLALMVAGVDMVPYFTGPRGYTILLTLLPWR